jgi:hypothetical protein
MLLSDSRQCQNLHAKYGSQVNFPNDDFYTYELSKFWSVHQSSISPACIYRPLSSQDVGPAILISRVTGCPFAIKSGGHAPHAGASNIADGITIDLVELNEITINEERSTVSVGPGNTWFDVYSVLQPKDLMVIGGRIADVGVGGLTLGGGLSFFSNIHGFACDNVASYEVVIASGDIVVASPENNADLYWGLRGGGNNFGLVTQFELYTYPLEKGMMWGGTLMHTGAQNSSLFDSFVEFGAYGAVADPNAALIMSMYYDQNNDAYWTVSQLEYAQPLPNETHPAVFDTFFSEPNAILDTTTTQTLIDIVLDFNSSNPSGLRQSYWVATFKLDAYLIQELMEIWVQEVEMVKTVVTGYVPVLSFQIITMPMIENMKKNGGNPLGLSEEGGPLMLVNPSAMWVNAADDEVVYGAYISWLAKATARAKELDLYHRYLYMNYASQFQDVIGGYGETSRAKMRDIAKKYDESNVFQVLQPGYFKL